jgi:hypothetical protein
VDAEREARRAEMVRKVEAAQAAKAAARASAGLGTRLEHGFGLDPAALEHLPAAEAEAATNAFLARADGEPAAAVASADRDDLEAALARVGAALEGRDVVLLLGTPDGPAAVRAPAAAVLEAALDVVVSPAVEVALASDDDAASGLRLGMAFDGPSFRFELRSWGELRVEL